MKKDLRIIWPNNNITNAKEGEDWFINAEKANIKIPKGCLVGNCGVCEIDVNGKVIRPCVRSIEYKNKTHLKIDFSTDPYW